MPVVKVYDSSKKVLFVDPTTMLCFERNGWALEVGAAPRPPTTFFRWGWLQLCFAFSRASVRAGINSKMSATMP
jgi:hypothetical protein